MLLYLSWLSFGGFLGASSANDIWSYRLPNKLMLLGFVLGVLCATLACGVSGLEQSLLGALLGFVLLFVPFALGKLGGGDVKFMGAVGAFLGPSAVLWALLYGMAAGGVLVVFYLQDMLRGVKVRLPYSVALAMGSLYVALERGLLAAGVMR